MGRGASIKKLLQYNYHKVQSYKFKVNHGLYGFHRLQKNKRPFFFSFRPERSVAVLFFFFRPERSVAVRFFSFRPERSVAKRSGEIPSLNILDKARKGFLDFARNEKKTLGMKKKRPE